MIDIDIDSNRTYQMMPQASMMLDRDLTIVNANTAFCDTVQQDRDRILGRFVFDVFPDTEERVRPVLQSFEAALSGKISKLNQQPFQLYQQDGSIEDRLWDIENAPMFSNDGEIVGIIHYCDDVTEREMLRKERDLISAELHHRVRNTLSVVQSVAEHSGHSSNSIDDFLKSFSGRLNAISRNFSALSDANWNGLEFGAIIKAELTPYAGPTLKRVTMSGPELVLSVKATKDASMIFHELITNASKYGFLTSPEGKLDIKWYIENETLHLQWREYGLTGLRAPDRIGFGFQLFEMFPNLVLQKEFADDGLRVTAFISSHIIEDQIYFD